MNTTFSNDPDGVKEEVFRLILSAPANVAPAIFTALAEIVGQQTEPPEGQNPEA